MEENREEQEYREQLAAELWDGGERAEFPGEQEEQQTEPEAAPEADPWEGVPAALKQTLEALQSKVSAIDTIGNEVKQWSGRVGAIQRELQLQRNAAEQAAKAVSEAPTKQQMAEAAQDDEAWSELKDEFPEWADALEKRTGKLEKKFSEQIESLRQQQPQAPDLSALHREYDQKIMAVKRELLAVKYPDWIQVVTSPEYTEWLNKQPGDVQQKALESTDASECIKVLDQFTAAKSPVRDVVDKRKERLANSVSAPSGGRPVRSKSIDDMTPEEYREHVAKQIWSN